MTRVQSTSLLGGAARAVLGRRSEVSRIDSWQRSLQDRADLRHPEIHLFIRSPFPRVDVTKHMRSFNLKLWTEFDT